MQVEPDRDSNRDLVFRLQSDLQSTQAQLKRLSLPRASSNSTRESVDSPDILPSSSTPSLGSYSSSVATPTPGIFVMEDNSEEGALNTD